jgi:hypothetical protein
MLLESIFFIYYYKDSVIKILLRMIKTNKPIKKKLMKITSIHKFKNFLIHN